MGRCPARGGKSTPADQERSSNVAATAGMTTCTEVAEGAEPGFATAACLLREHAAELTFAASHDDPLPTAPRTPKHCPQVARRRLCPLRGSTGMPGASSSRQRRWEVGEVTARGRSSSAPVTVSGSPSSRSGAIPPPGSVSAAPSAQPHGAKLLNDSAPCVTSSTAAPSTSMDAPRSVSGPSGGWSTSSTAATSPATCVRTPPRATRMIADGTTSDELLEEYPQLRGRRP
jgi:hypothetical protein